MPMDLQIAMVQGAMYPIVLTKLSTDYNVAEQKYNYFNMRDVSVISVCPSVRPSVRLSLSNHSDQTVHRL